jgi:hypothetical protein
VTLKRGGTGALTKVGELRYTPWGSNRASGYASGDTPTDYRFTNQREDSYINLYRYCSRGYDPYPIRRLTKVIQEQGSIEHEACKNVS